MGIATCGQGGGRPPERGGFPLAWRHAIHDDGRWLYKARRWTFESMGNVRHRVMPLRSAEVYNPYGISPTKPVQRVKEKEGQRIRPEVNRARASPLFDNCYWPFCWPVFIMASWRIICAMMSGRSAYLSALALRMSIASVLIVMESCTLSGRIMSGVMTG